ncbi:hypothetical protein FIBSPDRAFT_309358 [Athelia psychrophila]|uniref:Secreted protein n=1 Tax=Athelia psychrophila TaxID=1759441 RepID=A0A166W9S8_9AGAM|nr:hypothetical protein FIBSPDRAFT_309358 [Fibularhizoctonia sp. CBS 109695]
MSRGCALLVILALRSGSSERHQGTCQNHARASLICLEISSAILDLSGICLHVYLPREARSPASVRGAVEWHEVTASGRRKNSTPSANFPSLAVGDLRMIRKLNQGDGHALQQKPSSDGLDGHDELGSLR